MLLSICSYNITSKRKQTILNTYYSSLPDWSLNSSIPSITSDTFFWVLLLFFLIAFFYNTFFSLMKCYTYPVLLHYMIHISYFKMGTIRSFYYMLFYSFNSLCKTKYLSCIRPRSVCWTMNKKGKHSCFHRNYILTRGGKLMNKMYWSGQHHGNVGCFHCLLSSVYKQ